MTTTTVGRFEWERVIRSAVADDGAPLFVRADLAVLLLLGTYMDADGAGARPTVARLAGGSGYSEGQVRRSLTRAIELGHLARPRRGHRLGNGRSMASEYRAVVPTSTAHGCAVDSDDDPASTAQGCAVDEASTAHLDDLNRASGTPQPRTGARPPRHLHQNTTTTEVGGPSMRQRAEAIVADELAAGKDIGNRARYVDAVERRLRAEAIEVDRSARRFDVDRSCATCLGTGWGFLPDDAPRGAPVPPCPDCPPAVAS